MGDIERLPKWAQSEIANLNRRLVDAERRIADLQAGLTGDGGSDFGIEDGMGIYRLPSRAKHIAWNDGEFELRMRSEGNALEVMGTSWHGIVVRPSASNVVKIGPAR